MRRFAISLIVIATVVAGCAGEEQPEVATPKTAHKSPVIPWVPMTTTTTAPVVTTPKSIAKPPVSSRRIPEALATKVKAALQYGYNAGFSVDGCYAILLDFDYEMVGTTTMAQTITYSNVLTGELVPSECEINFNPDALTGDWEEDYTVYHEVSHLFSSTEREDHGPLFRSVESRMYVKLHLEVFYYTNSTYPDCFKISGRWVQSCAYAK